MKPDKNEFLTQLLGQFYNHIGLYFALLLIAYIGCGVRISYTVTKRDKQSPRTPVPFSWRFFWLDTLPRILRNLLLVPIALRFAPELFTMQATQWLAFGIGMGYDKLDRLLWKKNPAKDLIGDDDIDNKNLP